MKTTHSLLITLGLTSGALLLPLAARAQSPSPAPTATPSVSAPEAAAAGGAATGESMEQRKNARQERMAALTPEERERLKTAHEKAMQDPAVKAAEAEKSTDHRAYRQAMHAAMLRADPTIDQVLAKLRPEKGEGHGF